MQLDRAVGVIPPAAIAEKLLSLEQLNHIDCPSTFCEDSAIRAPRTAQ
jgi:hypothetical protein